MKKLLFAVLLGCQTFGYLRGAVPLGRIWERVDALEGLQANRLCMTGDAIHAVGKGGAIWKTMDRHTWTKEATFETDDLYGIATSNGTLVAVGAGGRILRKVPGGVWGAQAAGVGTAFRSVVFGGGLFVAVGDSGAVVRSTDGVNWSTWSSGITTHLYDIIWDGSMFRAVGQANMILSAQPGGTWMKPPQYVSYGADYKTIAFGGNGYVINGTMFSSDAITWISFSSTLPARNDAAAGAGVFVVAANFGEVIVSSDGVEWESVQTSSLENLVSVEWTGTEFIALTPTRNLVVSADGYRWRSKGLFPYAVSYQDGCWDGGQYVVVGDKRSIYTSPDGRWWTTEHTPAHGILHAVCSGGGNVVAVGDDSSILYSSDGRTWQKVAIPGYWDLDDVHWTGAEFLAVGSDGIVFTSTNASDWTISNPGRLDAVVWDGNRFLAFCGRNVLQSLNGNDWQSIASVDWYGNSTANDEMIHDIIWTGTYYLAVGDYGWILRSPDGLTWTRSTTPSAANSFYDLSSVAWSGSRFVATGTRYFGYSSDGLDWTMVDQGGSDISSDVAWSGSQFMAVWGAKVRSSSDGINWTLLHTRTGGSLNTITWSGSNWVMAGSTSTAAFVSTSTNGITWTTVNGDAGSTFNSVASVGGVHVAMDWQGKIKRFSAGTWTDEPSGLTGSPVSLVVQGDGFRTFDNYGMSSHSGSSAPWVPGDRRVSNDFLRSITSHNGVWVAGTQGWYGSEASIMTSADGRNWTKETFSGYQGPFVSSVWTGTEFQIVGGNCLYSSATGTNWSPQATTQWSSRDVRCIVQYDNELIVGGYGTTNVPYVIWNQNGANFAGSYRSSSGTILSLVAGPAEVLAIGTNETLVSQDGHAWSLLEPKPHLGANFTDVIHTPLGFFAVGDGAIVWQSPDGEVWSKSRTRDTLQLNALAWGNGKLVAVGSGLLNSSDGLQWNTGSISSIPSAFTDVVWGGDRFVAVASGAAAYSLDGLNWQRVVAPGVLNSVVWTGTAFVAGTADGMVVRSVDGSSWNLDVLPGDLYTIAYGNGIWMASTSAGGAYRSLDGETWNLGFDPARQSVSSAGAKVSFTGGRFFVFHPNGTFHSVDGLTWTRLSYVLADVVWMGTQFVGVGTAPITARSTNGTTWTYVGSSRKDLPAALVWTGSQVIEVGSGGHAYSSADGITWAAVATGTTRNLVDVVWTGTQAVALDSSASLVYFTSGTPLPTGVLGRNLLFAGGYLTVACDVGKIARLEESGWNVGETAAAPGFLGCIAEDASGLVAVGSAGTILRKASDVSTNTWTLGARSPRSGGTSVKIASVIDGALVSAGSDGKVKNSSDGKVWNLWHTPATTPLNAVVKVDGDLLAFGNLGKVLRIRPTAAVVPENSGTSARLVSAAFSGSRLVAVGDGGLILLSKSGSEAPFGYDRWIADEGASESQLQPDDDFNQDGVDNLVAYLHGFSTTDTNQLSRLPVIEISPGGPLLGFEIHTAYQDVEVTVLRTVDFVVWNEIARKIGAGSWSGSAWVAESAATEGRKRITVTDQSQPAISSAFYRLSVERR